MPIGNSNTFVVELNGIMFAIELGAQKGWNKLWLESYFMLVIFAFNNPSGYGPLGFKE